MATGAEHYAEAERLLAVCAGDRRGTPLDIACTAAAQVHATLALAAATALGHWTPDGTMPQPDRMDWWRAASGEPAERKRRKEAEAAELAEFAQEDPS